MSHFLTEEQELIRNNVREFAQTEIRPYAHLVDDEVASVKFSKDMAKKMAGLGLSSLILPEKLGGAGGDKVTQAVVAEEISKESPALGLLALNVMGGPAMCYRIPDMRKKFFEKFLAGEAIVSMAFVDPAGAVNFSEWPDMGTLEGDEWLLNGTKKFATFAPFCDVLMISGLVEGNMYNWWMERDTSGLSITVDPKCGLGRYDFGTITLRSVRLKQDRGFPWALVADRKIIGESTGLHGVSPALIMAVNIGLAQGVLDKTIEYLKVRTSQGKPIASLQAVQHQLAKMATEIEVSRCMVYTGLRLRDEKKPNWKLDHMVKAWVGEMPIDIARNCVRLFGGAGYTTALGIERYYRDALALSIGEMSTELRYQSIAHCLGLPDAEIGAF